MTFNRQDFIDGLRDLADFLESHPDVMAPEYPRQFTVFPATREEFAGVIRALGHCEKKALDTLYHVTRSFGPIQYQALIEREKVCERVVVGKKIVPAKAESEEEVIEWRCTESLLA